MTRLRLIVALQIVVTVLYALLGVLYATEGHWVCGVIQWVVVVPLGLVCLRISFQRLRRNPTW